MSVDAQPHQDRRVVPMGPAPIVKGVIRPLTKVLNPMIAKLAGRRGLAKAGMIHHVGRASGSRYVTPVRVVVNHDIALIPLTFGNESDWVRNIRVAGECLIQANGKVYRGMRPEFLPATAPRLRTAFKPFERTGFRLLGIKQFLQLQVVPA